MTVERVYTDAARPVEDRVAHLMTEMTVEEKVAQLAGVWVSDLIDLERRFSPRQARQSILHGTGHITRVGAVSMLPPVEIAKLTNDIQRFLVEETRLGIPAIIHEESCAGYLARGATTFPQAIGMAATWNPELVEAMAQVIRLQMRAVGAHQTLAPVLDVARDARWGRMEETFGEDPFLVSALGTAYIKGLQTDDWADGIMATAKHFIGYSLSEGGLNWAPAHIPERLLREVFLPPFIAAIRDGKAATVMNAYQELDGLPAGSATWLMVDLLRDELGFDGVVVSDYFTINMFAEYHHIAADKREAARYGLEAGLDVELPDSDCYGQPLLDALNDGEIDIALVDTAVRRVLDMKMRLRLFENPYADTGSVLTVYNTPEQIALTRTLAEQTIVLLKNESELLPLRGDLKTIAVIGPSADSPRLMQGDYHYPAHMEGITDLPQDSMEAPAPGKQLKSVDWEEHRPPTTTVLQGIRARAGAGTEVIYAQGCTVTGTDTSGFAEATAAAQRADVAIVVVGDLSGLGKGSTSGEAIDRATLELPGVQQDLIQAVHATGTPTVVVLLNGRSPALTQIVDQIPAILEAWLPAQEGGAAIARVLFGDVNPGGKLPVSFPRAAGQMPLYYNHKPSGQRSHWHGEYADMSPKPLFPFGHGLCYTSFAYDGLEISPAEATADDVVSIRVRVENVGERAGDEVVQLYVQDLIGSVTRPVKELKGFKRITLQPREAKTITFKLDVRHLAFYDRRMKRVVEPGTIAVMIGSSSDDIRLTGEFEIVGPTTEVDHVSFTPVEVR
ncbi:MAG: glycoside hydrolase family 3 C-terminal domain-containing protein [Anaerolineae bacterium]|nr:glycoside hydrolase family 3 C-terminal domain-containing protein [Anaerolineae bacterium]